MVIKDELVASHLFRIAQEAVNNAIRHGKAQRITIHLTERAGQFCLEIHDDGVGLAEKRPASTGMGLRTMKYQAEVIGVQFETRRAAGKGTVVACRLIE